MSNELKVKLQQPNLTLYAILFNSSGQVWNTSEEDFESYATANRGDYDISLTEQGTASGIYYGDFPSAIVTAGTYYYSVYYQTGASPAEPTTDVLVATNLTVDWTGTAAAESVSGALSGSDWLSYFKRGGFLRTDKDTEVYEATTDAIQEMRRRFSFDEAQTETTTTDTLATQGDFKVDIETDLGLVMGVILEDGTDAYTLTHVSKATFDELYPDINVDTNYGCPRHYTIFQGQIYVGPAVDLTTYVLRISYSKRAGTVTSSTASVPLTNLYRDVLRDLTNHYLYEALDEFDKATYFRGKFETKWIDVIRRERHNQGAGQFAVQVRDC